MAVAGITLAAVGLFACDDDSAVPTGGADAAPDTSIPKADAAPPIDGSTTVDSSTSDADAGPTISMTLGSTGVVDLEPDFISGFFFSDETIVRVSDIPECVVHVGSASKPFSPAGTVSVGGQIVGSDGGTAQAIEINPLPSNAYEYPGESDPSGPIFAPFGGPPAQISMTSTSDFPALPVQTLQTPAFEQINVTAPVIPDAGPVVVSSAAPLQITWTVPTSGNVTGQQILFRLTNISAKTNPKYLASLRCAYPLSAGKATIPTRLLSELKTRVGGEATALIRVHLGDQKEFSTGGVSYVVSTLRGDSTNFLGALEAELQ